jgi:hypothetical protein
MTCCSQKRSSMPHVEAWQAAGLGSKSNTHAEPGLASAAESPHRPCLGLQVVVAWSCSTGPEQQDASLHLPLAWWGCLAGIR